MINIRRNFLQLMKIISVCFIYFILGIMFAGRIASQIVAVGI